MKSLILIAIFCVYFQWPVRALDCSVGNPCGLDSYYNAARGYTCRQRGTQALCTCPGGDYEIDFACRLCNRKDPLRDACNKASPNYVICLEDDSYGTPYVCLCQSPGSSMPAATLDWDCNLSVTLTSTSTTTTTTAASTSSICLNGGVYARGVCNCPSGFSGALCELRYDNLLCDRVVCKNGGVCGIRNPTGQYESYCACLAGTWGDYCEINGTTGTCTPTSCLNGGACRENRIGTRVDAYCFCAPGYSGVKCETQSFTCTSAGNFIDLQMYEQGRYFNCTLVNGVYRIKQLSCPKGLRFDMGANACTK